MNQNASGPGGPQRTPPVKEGEELDVVIEAVGEKGDGIAKKKGFILFVKDTQQGESCRIRVTKVLQKVGFAEKIGPAKSQPEPSKPKPKPIQPAPEPEPRYEDTEDFGAELEQEEQTPPGQPADTPYDEDKKQEQTSPGQPADAATDDDENLELELSEDDVEEPEKDAD